MSELTLLLPGLFGPLPAERAGELPRFPFLETLLARADRAGAATAPESALFDLFNIPIPPGLGAPIAPLTRWAESGQRPEGFWLRADPVHLTADQDRVYLTAAGDWPISVEEGRRIAAELNPWLMEEGMRLEAGSGSHWHLSVASAPRLHTRSPADCIGRDIHDCLPRGEDAGRWRARQSELEMLLYASPVNEERSRRGLPAINALWLWGGGELPDAPATAPFDHVFSDEPLARGLALLCDTPQEALPHSATDLPGGGGRRLVVCSALRAAVVNGDLGAFADGLKAVVEAWLRPLSGRLRDGSLTTLKLIGAPGPTLVVSARHSRRLWRRRLPLSAWMQR